MFCGLDHFPRSRFSHAERENRVGEHFVGCTVAAVVTFSHSSDISYEFLHFSPIARDIMSKWQWLTADNTTRTVYAVMTLHVDEYEWKWNIYDNAPKINVMLNAHSFHCNLWIDLHFHFAQLDPIRNGGCVLCVH